CVMADLIDCTRFDVRVLVQVNTGANGDLPPADRRSGHIAPGGGNAPNSAQPTRDFLTSEFWALKQNRSAQLRLAGFWPEPFLPRWHRPYSCLLLPYSPKTIACCTGFSPKRGSTGAAPQGSVGPQTAFAADELD